MEFASERAAGSGDPTAAELSPTLERGLVTAGLTRLGSRHDGIRRADTGPEARAHLDPAGPADQRISVTVGDDPVDANAFLAQMGVVVRALTEEPLDE